MQKSQVIDHCIESICSKGCRQVWGQIDALESGQEVPEARGLNREEKAFVLSELKTIMAVYASRCSVD